MSALWEFVLRHGYGLMFAAVMIEQLGAPIPAVPVLLVMGALAGLGEYSFGTAFLLAVFASVAADLLWFHLGRRHGDSILTLLCKLSLEPDSCVRSTTNAFDRYGPATLLIAKFVPGLSTVAPPLAGTAGLSAFRFLIHDAAGAALWAGSALGSGYLVRREVERAADWLSRFGLGMMFLLGAPLAAWILWKYWQRRRIMRILRIARITPAELKAHLDIAASNSDGTQIVDVRSHPAIRRSGAKIPGALVLSEDELDLRLRDLPRGAHLVFYCS